MMEKVLSLETERLWLRPFAAEDGQGLGAMLGDPQVMRFYGGGVTQSEESAQATLDYHLRCRAHDYWAWAVTGKDDGRFIGSITAAATEFRGERWFEPAWILARQEWGQGLATEAARAVVKHAIAELKWTRLLTTTHPLNAASQRVVEKAGFAFTGEAEVRPGRPALVFIMRSA